jgi:hypothetical protein
MNLTMLMQGSQVGWSLLLVLVTAVATYQGVLS